MTIRGLRWVLLAVCLVVGAPAQAGVVPQATTAMSPAQAREDLELAIDAVEAALPNIYWHQSRRAWTMAKAAARREVAGVTDSEALWRVLRPLLGQIGEGHMSVEVSAAMRQAYREAPRFPLDLLWTEEGAFVLAGYGEAAAIPKGSRLVSIDGVTQPDLLRQAVAVTPHDGVIRTGVMRELTGRGFASVLYRLRGAQPSFRVVLDGPAGPIDRPLAAVPRTARPPEPEDSAPLPTLEWLDDHTAYLVVPTFSNSRFRAVGATFFEAIHDIFVELEQRGARDLILDIRENGGGSEPNESILFSYLVEEPLRKYAAVEARGGRLSITSLSGRLYEVEVFDADDPDRQRPIGGGRLTRRNTPPHGLMSRWTTFEPVYRGRLVVLAGGYTFSGGAELASMLRRTHRAVFVGEEVGGAHEGNTSGYFWRLELPNSGMKIRIPLLQFRLAWSSRPHGRGVLPDCPAQPRADEFGIRRDRAWRMGVALFDQDWRVPRQAVCSSV